MSAVLAYLALLKTPTMQTLASVLALLRYPQMENPAFCAQITQPRTRVTHQNVSATLVIDSIHKEIVSFVVLLLVCV
jgi:hypothetical protein